MRFFFACSLLPICQYHSALIKLRSTEWSRNFAFPIGNRSLCFSNFWRVLPRVKNFPRIPNSLGPRLAEGEFGPKEFHLVLLDNGRSKILKDPIGRDVLKCIRCGACADVCLVKNPIPIILRHLRRRVAQGDELSESSMSAPIRATASLASLAFAWNWIYRLGTHLLPIINPFFRKNNWLSNMPYPLSRWTRVRPLPPFGARFRKWWIVRSAKETESTR